MDINFYKKQTVLNDIFENTNTVIINNSQLINSINNAKSNQLEYLVSNIGDVSPSTNYKNSTSNLSKLYRSNYSIDPSKSSISNDEIIKNIKRYNNFTEASSIIDEKKIVEYVLPQQKKYNNYDYTSPSHSLVLDTTYNLLYYIQYDRMNLMSYYINTINGFNYNSDNHMLYFDIDNEYICSINNTLYYNFNNIQTTSKKDKGISLINPNFFDTTRNDYYQNSAVLNLNKDFKYDLFTTINKLKNTYYDCENIANTLSYYANIEEYNNHYLNLDENAYITYIIFDNTKLYYSDKKIGINALEVNGENTLYISNLENSEFKIGYISNVTNNYNYNYVNSYNMNLFKNRTSFIIDGNNINSKISYNYNYKYISEFFKTNFVETSTSVWESQSHTTIVSTIKENIINFPITSSYNISISSNIDQMIFKNSGMNIIYNGTPYLSYFEQKVGLPKKCRNIVIPLKNELNIRPINSKVFGYSSSKKSCIKDSFISKSSNISGSHYYLLSSKNLFDTSNLDFIKLWKLLDGKHIYLKGTARDVNAEITSTIPCEVRINDGENLIKNPISRGLNLVTIDKKTFTVVDRANYDTYGQATSDQYKHNNGISLLKEKLNNINDDVFICLTSFDAIGWDGTGKNSLIRKLQEFGMSDLPYTEVGRYPFLFMGCKNLGKGNGFTKMLDKGSWYDVVELSTNGEFGPQYMQNGATSIYLKGTAYDKDQGRNNYVYPGEIRINGGDNLIKNPIGRGLNLVTINKQTFTFVDRANYDTYGEAGSDPGSFNNGITELKKKLNEIKNNVDPYNDKDVFVCIVSYDAIGWDNELISLLQEFGMSDLPYTDTYRYPFLFMGCKNLGKGNGFTKMNDLGSAPNEVTLTTYIGSKPQGKIQITSPQEFQISGLNNYNCYTCTIPINEYLFNELYSSNVISQTPNLYYYQTAPLYIENYKGELIDNNYNQNKEYIPALNNHPTKYLNDKFFDSKIYLDGNYPTKEELDTCISDIKDIKTIYGNNKLYLYEIYKANNGYYLEFYTILPDNSKVNISETDIIGITNMNISNSSKTLYNNQLSGYLQDKKRLYQYLSQYLNNFITF